MKMLFYLSLILLIILFISEGFVFSRAKESQFEIADYVLLMGSGTDTTAPILRERLLRAEKALNENPGAKLIISGKSEEVDAMKVFFKSMTSEIILDPTAQRTVDHFIFLKKIGAQNIILATNDFHYPRALAIAQSFSLFVKTQKDPINYVTSGPKYLREILGRLRFSYDVLIGTFP
jgi:uncharacterized SAM-binding protein YcdF (DUF218 family)